MPAELSLERMTQVIDRYQATARWSHGAVPGMYDEAEVATPDANDVAGLEGIRHVRAPSHDTAAVQVAPSCHFRQQRQ